MRNRYSTTVNLLVTLDSNIEEKKSISFPGSYKENFLYSIAVTFKGRINLGNILVKCERDEENLNFHFITNGNPFTSKKVCINQIIGCNNVFNKYS
jgi:hypothetical protein